MKGSFGSWWAGKPVGLDHELCAPQPREHLGVGTGGVAEGRAMSAEMRGVGIFWHQEEDRGDRCPGKAVMCLSVYEREKCMCNEWACLPRSVAMKVLSPGARWLAFKYSYHHLLAV